MVQLHFLAEFLQRRIAVHTRAPSDVVPPLEEHGIGLPLPVVNILRVPTVMEAEGVVPRYSHIVPLIKIRSNAEINTCGMAERGYCASDSSVEARLRCLVCGQNYHHRCMGVRRRVSMFECGCHKKLPFLLKK